MFKATSYLLVGLVVLVGLQTAQVNAKCEMTFEDLDKCAMQSNLFGNPKWTVPQTEAELDTLCMNSFAQTVFAGIQQLAKKDFKDRCVDPEGRKAFLTHVNCAKAEVDREHIFNCVHGFLGQINHQIDTHAAMTTDDRIQTSCCAIAQLHECLIENVKKVCANSFDYWKTKMIMSEHMEATCNKFQTVEYCDGNASPNFWPKLKKVFISPEKEGVNIKYNSPVTALIVLLSKN